MCCSGKSSVLASSSFCLLLLFLSPHVLCRSSAHKALFTRVSCEVAHVDRGLTSRFVRFHHMRVYVHVGVCIVLTVVFEQLRSCPLAPFRLARGFVYCRCLHHISTGRTPLLSLRALSLSPRVFLSVCTCVHLTCALCLLSRANSRVFEAALPVSAPRHAALLLVCVFFYLQVFESIMSADLSLKETLMLFDRNCDGTVSFREFNELITELDVGESEASPTLSTHPSADLSWSLRLASVSRFSIIRLCTNPPIAGYVSCLAFHPSVPPCVAAKGERRS